MTEESFDRLSLAKEQLETALDLFLDCQSLASAITLAGAAEGVFGQALSLQDEAHALDHSYTHAARLHELLHNGSELKRKQYIQYQNRARDALKHLQEEEGSTIKMDLEEAACWILVRALENGQGLGIEFSRFEEFDNWFYENIVGI